MWQQPVERVLRVMRAEETSRVVESTYPLHPPSSSATQMLTHSLCPAQTLTETSCLVARGGVVAAKGEVALLPYSSSPKVAVASRNSRETSLQL